MKEFILEFGAWLLFIPTVWIPILIFNIYKALVVLLAKYIYGPDVQPHSGMTHMFINEEFWSKRTCANNIGRAMIVDGELKLDQIRDLFKQRILDVKDPDGKHKYEAFYQINFGFMGYMFSKVQETVDVQRHIVQGPQLTGGDDEFANYVMEARGDPYSRDEPFWRVIVFPYDQVKNETRLVFWISHLVADGYSVLHIMERLTGNPVPYKVPAKEGSFFDTVKLYWRGPLLLIRLYASTFAPNWTKDPFSDVEHTRIENITKFVSMDLKPLLEIRKKTGVRFSSLMATLVTSTLRRFLLDSRAENKLPEYIMALTSLPWARPKGSPSVFGNYFSMGFIRQKVRDGSSLERLLDYEKELVEFQSSGTHEAYHKIAYSFYNILPAPVLLRLAAYPHGAYFYSPMMGNRDPQLKVLGHEVKATYPMSSIFSPTITSFIPTVSQGDRIHFCMNLNKYIVKDIDGASRYAKYFQKEISSLLDQINNIAVPIA